MNDKITMPIKLTEASVSKLRHLISDENNQDMKLRIYITGGGCSGFQYGFVLDDKISIDDITIEICNIKLVIDPMSLQYLIGSTLDYIETLEGSRFIVINPNVKSTCGCGYSFGI